jgi:hypothetical protein
MQLPHLAEGPDLYLLAGREWTGCQRLSSPPSSGASTGSQHDKHSERGFEQPRSWQRRLARRRWLTLATTRPLDVTRYGGVDRIRGLRRNACDPPVADCQTNEHPTDRAHPHDRRPCLGDDGLGQAQE